jgi:hypothetical protein
MLKGPASTPDISDELIKSEVTSCGNGLSNDGFDRQLLNNGEHLDENFAIPLSYTGLMPSKNPL